MALPISPITRAQIPNQFVPTTFMVSGFNTAGDIGCGAVYTAGVSTGPMAIQDLSGAWFQLVLSGVVNAGWFGIDNTKVIDCVASLQAAINATPLGGELLIPHGGYLVKGTTFSTSPDGGGVTTCLLRTTPIRIVGLGLPTFYIDATVPNTRDIFTYSTNIATNNAWELSHIFINQNQGTPAGRHGLHMTCSGASGNMYDATISDNVMYPMGAGRSINVANTVVSTGGLAYSRITRNNVESIYLSNVGDGVTVSENTLNNTGAVAGVFNACVYAFQVPGAANMRIINNTISGIYGHILFTGGVGLLISGNEMETPSGITNGAGYVISIDGTLLAVQSTQIIDNSISVLPSTGNPIAIKVGPTTSTNNSYISGGRLLVQSGGTHIQVGAGALATKIDSKSVHFTVGGATTAGTITDTGSTGTEIFDTSYSSQSGVGGTINLIPNYKDTVYVFTTTPTSSVTVTLSTINMNAGMRARIKAPAALGGFTFTANGVSLSAAQFTDAIFDGTVWRVS